MCATATYCSRSASARACTATSRNDAPAVKSLRLLRGGRPGRIDQARPKRTRGGLTQPDASTCSSSTIYSSPKCSLRVVSSGSDGARRPAEEVWVGRTTWRSCTTSSPTDAILFSSTRNISASADNGPQLVKSRSTTRSFGQNSPRDSHEPTGQQSEARRVQTSKVCPLQALLPSRAVRSSGVRVSCVDDLAHFPQYLPNYTVNRVMKTENFDDGSFLLFVDPPLPRSTWQ